MIVHKPLLKIFVEFLQSAYGVINPLRSKKRGDEYGRFLLRGKFFVIRDNEEGIGDTVEVHTSDTVLKQEVEEAWLTYFAHLVKEESSDGMDKSVDGADV